MGCHSSKNTAVTPSYTNQKLRSKGDSADTADEASGRTEVDTQFGIHKAKTIAEVKELEDNMGGKLADSYVMGPYAASAIFYEVRKVFN